MQEKKQKVKKPKKSSSFGGNSTSFSDENPDVDGILDDLDAAGKELTEEEKYAMDMLAGNKISEEQATKVGVKRKQKSSCGCF